jgi:hypothetical protein
MPKEREHLPDWEHLLFLALLLGFVTWYLWTAAAASATFSNLILIAPVGAAAMLLLLYIGVEEIFGLIPGATATKTGQTEASTNAADGRFRSGSLRTIAALMGLFGLFVVSMPYIGFDIATFFFVVATMWLLGERRVIFSLSLALGVAAALSIAALTLLTFPMPLGIARVLWSGL